MQEMWGQEDPLEKEMATHSSNFAWEIPWTEEPGGLHSHGIAESDTTEQLNITQHKHILNFSQQFLLKLKVKLISTFSEWWRDSIRQCILTFWQRYQAHWRCLVNTTSISFPVRDWDGVFVFTSLWSMTFAFCNGVDHQILRINIIYIGYSWMMETKMIITDYTGQIILWPRFVWFKCLHS